MKAGELTPPSRQVAGATPALPPLRRGAKASASLFFGAVVAVVLAGLFPALRTVPGHATDPAVVGMPIAIVVVMLGAAALIVTATRAPVAEVPRCKKCQSGLTAIIVALT